MTNFVTRLEIPRSDGKLLAWLVPISVTDAVPRSGDWLRPIKLLAIKQQHIGNIFTDSAYD